MAEYKAKDFNNRKALEEQIVTDYGRTVDRKDAKISGTVVQLEELRLSHNQSIWGVPVVANNYQPKNHKIPPRGKRTRGTLNGV